jgi:hypothetical protein
LPRRNGFDWHHIQKKGRIKREHDNSTYQVEEYTPSEIDGNTKAANGEHSPKGNLGWLFGHILKVTGVGCDGYIAVNERT